MLYHGLRNAPRKTGLLRFCKQIFPACWKKVLSKISASRKKSFLRREVALPHERGVTGMERQKWIAVDAKTEEVVARGDSIEDATEKAKRKGVEEPVVTRVVPEGQDLFF
jgi:hypothetical protein